jgi:hypothetical protein
MYCDNPCCAIRYNRIDQKSKLSQNRKVRLINWNFSPIYINVIGKFQILTIGRKGTQFQRQICCRCFTMTIENVRQCITPAYSTSVEKFILIILGRHSSRTFGVRIIILLLIRFFRVHSRKGPDNCIITIKRQLFLRPLNSNNQFSIKSNRSVVLVGLMYNKLMTTCYCRLMFFFLSFLLFFICNAFNLIITLQTLHTYEYFFFYFF